MSTACTTSQKQELSFIFKEIDVNKTGQISLESLKSCLNVMGINNVQDEFISKFSNVSPATFTLPEFINIISQPFNAVPQEELDSAFDHLDRDSDSALNSRDLMQSFDEAELKISAILVEDMINEISSNIKAGCIKKSEFVMAINRS